MKKKQSNDLGGDGKPKGGTSMKKSALAILGVFVAWSLPCRID